MVQRKKNNYSHEELAKLFDEVKQRAYPELKMTNLKTGERRTLGYSSPFTKNIYYNETKINFYSKSALIGFFAHELSHQISYKNRAFFKKFLFLYRYPLGHKKTIKKVEYEANEIAIERGFRRELIELQKEVSKNYSGDRLEILKECYMTVDEIKNYKN